MQHILHTFSSVKSWRWWSAISLCCWMDVFILSIEFSEENFICSIFYNIRNNETSVIVQKNKKKSTSFRSISFSCLRPVSSLPLIWGWVTCCACLNEICATFSFSWVKSDKQRGHNQQDGLFWEKSQPMLQTSSCLYWFEKNSSFCL